MNTQKLINKSQRQPVYEEWLNTLPSAVAAAMRDYLPEYADCYRIVGDGDGHYFFLQVNEPFGDLPVTCNLLHGRHSSAAGTRLTGVPLAELFICDCGTLQFPYPLFVSETMHLNVPFIVRRYFLPEPLLYRHHLMPGSRNADREYSVGGDHLKGSQAPKALALYDDSVSNVNLIARTSISLFARRDPNRSVIRTGNTFMKSGFARYPRQSPPHFVFIYQRLLTAIESLAMVRDIIFLTR